MGLNQQEIVDLLNRARMGVVGTLRKDGSPQVTPLWFRYDGDAFYLWTQENRVWVTNVVRDPRVAFSVYDEKPPFNAVMIRGKAEITTEESQAVLDEIIRISRRYVEEKDMDTYLAGFWPQLKTIVRIIPESISTYKGD